MTGTECGLFTHKSVPVIFEPTCMSIPPQADTDSKEGKVPEKAKAAVLVESFPLPEGTPTVKDSKPLIHTCRVWY